MTRRGVRATATTEVGGDGRAYRCGTVVWVSYVSVRRFYAGCVVAEGVGEENTNAERRVTIRRRVNGRGGVTARGGPVAV